MLTCLGDRYGDAPSSAHKRPWASPRTMMSALSLVAGVSIVHLWRGHHERTARRRADGRR